MQRLKCAMFYEFPDDEKCWELTDQYMFGPECMIAPVLEAGTDSRKVYLPKGTWQDIHSGEMLEGGGEILAEALLDSIPVFTRMGDRK